MPPGDGPVVPIRLQSVNRYQTAKCTSDLFCLSNNKELIDFGLLLPYFSNANYGVYCNKYKNIRQICEEPEKFQQERDAIRVKDVILFTRDTKFWKILKQQLNKRKVQRLREKGNTNPTSKQKRVIFSPLWTDDRKHNTLMISTQNDGLIICWNCYLSYIRDDLCNSRSNNYCKPHDALGVSTASLNTHYSSDGHKSSTNIGPSESVMLMRICVICFDGLIQCKLQCYNIV